SVLGFDSKTNTVTVRNPWGESGDPALNNPGDTDRGITYKGDGVMTMSLDTFYNTFANESFSGKGPGEAEAQHLLKDASNLTADSAGVLKGLISGNLSESWSSLKGVFTDNNGLNGDSLHALTTFLNVETKHFLSNPAAFANPLAALGISNPATLLTDPFAAARNVEQTVQGDAGTVVDLSKDAYHDVTSVWHSIF
ncbi:MAG TPA: hypothetical protein V6C72_09460, partial [Chroococcales cyanobacterium]